MRKAAVAEPSDSTNGPVWTVHFRIRLAVDNGPQVHGFQGGADNKIGRDDTNWRAYLRSDKGRHFPTEHTGGRRSSTRRSPIVYLGRAGILANG